MSGLYAKFAISLPSALFSSASKTAPLPSRVSLLDLPNEILVNILCLLDFRTIVSCKRACHSLYTVSQVQILWIHAYRTLECRPPLERPLLSHSSTELEAVVTKAARIEAIWNNEPPPTFIKREIVLPWGAEMELLPGGKWLLGYDQMGRVIIYDLDSPTLQSTFLIPKGPNAWGKIIDVSTSVHEDAPCFTFDLAVGYIGERKPTRARDLQFSIFRVNAISKDGTSTLQSDLLQSFPVSEVYSVGQVTVFGDHLAISHVRDGNLDNWVDIYEWKNCTSTSSRLTSIAFHGKSTPTEVRLLHYNMLLVVHKRCLIAIYSIPPMASHTFSEGQPSRTTCQSLYEVSCERLTGGFGVSPSVYWARTIPPHMTILISRDHEVSVIRVAPPPALPQVTHVKFQRQDKHAFAIVSRIGHRRGLRLCDHPGDRYFDIFSLRPVHIQTGNFGIDGSAILGSDEWRMVEKRVFLDEELPPCRPLLDESSGRVVWYAPWKDRLPSYSGANAQTTPWKDRLSSYSDTNAQTTRIGIDELNLGIATLIVLDPV